MSGRNKLFRPRTSLALILTACLLHCVAVSNDSIFTIDDASDSGQFYTSPTTTTSAPLNFTGSTEPQWTHENCSSCLDKPDLTAVNGGTYTAVYLPPGNTFQYNISFQFHGSTIHVYFILSKQAPTSCKFILDGGATPYTGLSVDAFQYRTLAFSSDKLPLQLHTLTIMAEGEPDKANYLNFDFANFTRPSTTILAVRSTNETITYTPLPTSSAPPNNHTTLKAIIGGVVGGFIAVVLLIVVAAFYRSRRLRELEEAHPFTQTQSRKRANVSRTALNEREHLVPYTLSASPSSHHERGKSSTTAPGVTPHDLLRPPHHQTDMTRENRHQRREERRLELNHRLQAVTTQMRSLKTSYAQDQTRLQQEALQRQQQQQQRQRQRQRQRQNMYFEVNGNTANPSTSDPPLATGGALPPAGSMAAGGRDISPASNLDHPPAAVPLRMPEPFTPAILESENSGEPMVNPYVLADMRTQMGIMMDQIQYLRAQQNSPYIQGLTDEPPPGYMDVIGSYHHRSP